MLSMGVRADDEEAKLASMGVVREALLDWPHFFDQKPTGEEESFELSSDCGRARLRTVVEQGAADHGARGDVAAAVRVEPRELLGRHRRRQLALGSLEATAHGARDRAAPHALHSEQHARDELLALRLERAVRIGAVEDARVAQLDVAERVLPPAARRERTRGPWSRSGGERGREAPRRDREEGAAATPTASGCLARALISCSAVARLPSWRMLCRSAGGSRQR